MYGGDIALSGPPRQSIMEGTAQPPHGAPSAGDPGYDTGGEHWCGAGYDEGGKFVGDWEATGPGQQDAGYDYQAGGAHWCGAGYGGAFDGGWEAANSGDYDPGYAGGEAVGMAAGQGYYADGGGWTGGWGYGAEMGFALPEEPEEFMQECWVLWVGSLPPRLSEEELLEAFSVYGPIASVSVKSQQQSGKIFSKVLHTAPLNSQYSRALRTCATILTSPIYIDLM